MKKIVTDEIAGHLKLGSSYRDISIADGREKILNMPWLAGFAIIDPRNGEHIGEFFINSNLVIPSFFTKKDRFNRIFILKTQKFNFDETKILAHYHYDSIGSMNITRKNNGCVYSDFLFCGFSVITNRIAEDKCVDIATGEIIHRTSQPEQVVGLIQSMFTQKNVRLEPNLRSFPLNNYYAIRPFKQTPLRIPHGQKIARKQG